MYDAVTMTNKERAVKAAEERWHPTIPKATHSGIIHIAGKEIACDVLEDGRRMLRQKTLIKAMGKGQLGSYDQKRGEELNLPIFLTANNLTPYLEDDFTKRGQIISYRGENGKILNGYDATILPEACKVYVKADDDGKLQKTQLSIAKVCRAMLYGLATVGIISLVDDATGYVEHRNRTELEKILQNYISEELRGWTQKFPNEFFKQIYRLHGWEYPKIGKNHPQYVGKIINKYVYDRLPPGVLAELKNKNPLGETGNRKFRHHQFLSEEIGDKNLQGQIQQVVTLMRVSKNIDEFKELMSRSEFIELT